MLAHFSGTLAHTAWPNLAQPWSPLSVQLSAWPGHAGCPGAAALASGRSPKYSGFCTAPAGCTWDRAQAIVKMLSSSPCRALAAATEHAQTHLPCVHTCLWARWTNMKIYFTCQMPPVLPRPSRPVMSPVGILLLCCLLRVHPPQSRKCSCPWLLGQDM